MSEHSPRPTPEMARADAEKRARRYGSFILKPSHAQRARKRALAKRQQAKRMPA